MTPRIFRARERRRQLANEAERSSRGGPIQLQKLSDAPCSGRTALSRQLQRAKNHLWRSSVNASLALAEQRTSSMS